MPATNAAIAVPVKSQNSLVPHLLHGSSPRRVSCAALQSSYSCSSCASPTSVKYLANMTVAQIGISASTSICSRSTGTE